MSIFHRQILRLLPAPFFGWLGTLMFLLLMQFLIRYLPDIIGKGLPPGVITELLAYNLAYMVVLAVPMSALIASLMAFGRLAETNAYLVMKTAGVSLPQLIWPVVLLSMMMSGGMWYFNNEVLPEANFRAKNLWQDIRRKKPGFQLEPGVFYEGLNGYSILIKRIPALSNELHDILVEDYSGGSEQPVTIKAARGRIESIGDGSRMDLILERGELHRQRMVPGSESEQRYERLAFATYRVRLDLKDFTFERSDPREGYRSDRTMRTADMVALVDSLRTNADSINQSIASVIAFRDSAAATTTPVFADTARTRLARQKAAGKAVTATNLLAGLDSNSVQDVQFRAVQRAETARTKIEEMQRSLEWENQRADRYLVEIHKKSSIAVACIIFMLIGAPLGLSVKRGGLGVAGGLAIAIFLFYWVTLVQGEKMADRGFLPPWFGMWIANIVVLIGALYLFVYQTLDLGARPRLWRRLAGWRKAPEHAPTRELEQSA